MNGKTLQILHATLAGVNGGFLLVGAFVYTIGDTWNPWTALMSAAAFLACLLWVVRIDFATTNLEKEEAKR